MTQLFADPFDFIQRLPLWRGTIEIEPLQGGITNLSYVVRDPGRTSVVRLGGDIPVHGVMRFSDHAASRAASAAGISPPVLYSDPAALVIAYIDGKTLRPEDVRTDRSRCVALVARAHREIPNHLRGPILSFNIFHVLRDYRHTLIADGSRHLAELSRLMTAVDFLERAAGPIDLVFGHNDLAASNLIDDGERLWLIDWDYAGFNTPLFDLGGLSSNNGFTPDDDEAMLKAYFERPATDELRYRFRAMCTASLLRETMWSMVSELHSTLSFDYEAYTAGFAARFEAAYSAFRQFDRP